MMLRRISSYSSGTAGRLTLVAAALWILVILASLLWNLHQVEHSVITAASVEAQSTFQKDLVYRRWAAKHGGVYVPPTDETPPNPYLSNIPDRDVTTTSGKKLTLLNPAYITRQVHELGREQYGAQGHITSLNPIRPENAPDAWEAEALRAFETGIKEKSSVEIMNGEPYFRLMHPLTTEASCLKCHAGQGYKEGDIRGGISVSVPLEPYRAVAREQKSMLLFAHALIGGLGLAGLWIGSFLLRLSNAHLRESKERFRAVIEQAGDGFELLDSEGRYVDMNSATLQMLGYSREELLALSIADIDPLTSREEYAAGFQSLLNHPPMTFEKVHRRKDGATFPVEVTVSLIHLGGKQYGVSLVRDTTERKQAEEDRKKLEAQLVQAQKMESIGRLAGGVAHDFNNMLGVILGHAELAMEEVEPEQPLHASLKEIQKAAEHSADLTRQLLAFARRQTVAPKVLDLNETVTSMLKMLQRLIGEDIDLHWQPGEDLWPVKVDPSQIDQILANLSVNARDAIAGTGKVMIETANRSIDKAYCAVHEDVMPGQYVMLAVSDDGCGMDKAILEHVFEPFFTTKGMGYGTGMGLATVYGIVKQNEGFVDILSEPGQGTAFKIYLPRAEGKTAETLPEAPVQPARARGETVLLVEDETALLMAFKIMLESLGYAVLAAGAPEEALRQAAAYDGEIHLVLSDVVMPEMNGRTLEERIRAIRPEIRCLFMSGYTADAITHHGILGENVLFIQKPFSRHTLAAKMREALDFPRVDPGVRES